MASEGEAPAGEGRRNRRTGRCLGCAGIAVVAIAVAVGGAAWTITRSGRHSLEAMRAQIRARGEPLSGAELNQPPIPDVQNAVVPLRAAADGLVPDTVAERFDGMGNDDPATWPPDTVVALRRWVGANQQALALVREAARRPQCRFPVDYTPGLNTTFPRYREVRDLAPLVRASASVGIAEHRYEAAAADIATGLALGDCLDREPTLGGKFVQYAVHAIALEPARALLREPGVPAEALKMQRRALDRAAQTGGLGRALVGERAIALTGFEMVYGQSPGASGVSPGATPQARGHYLWFLAEPDEAYYLEHIAQAIKLADQPHYLVAPKLKRWGERAESDERRFPPKVLGSIMLPLFGQAAWAQARVLARLQTARVATAVRLQYLRAGKLPQKLEGLVPSELAAVPVDPFSGQPLRCRIEADGRSFRVYSVGENMKDDGGVERPRKGQGGAAPQGGPDDIVVVGVMR